MVTGDADLGAADPALARALAAERVRQETFLELIASENYVSPRVLEAQGSVLTNKYADGYPGRRFYSGCEHVDVVERLAIERACALFGAAHANVQPYSGSQANVAAFLALAAPGDTLLAMDPAAGGHRTHGAADNITGQIFSVRHYGVDPESGLIDYDAVERLARKVRPKIVVAGFSAYARVVDWQRFREIADEVGAALVADMAHVAGLVAAGLYPNPVPIADVTTSTTHKTLRGPRGGLILTRDRALGERVDAAVYPGNQGGPLAHVIAAKAAAFGEAMRPEFEAYQRAVIANAQWLAGGLARRGYAVVGGGTDNHMVLIDLGRSGGRGTSAEESATAEAALERAHLAVNRITVPGQPAGTPPRGLRLGTPAVTTRGLTVAEIDRLTGWVGDVLDSPDDEEIIEYVRGGALELCAAFPVYG